MDISIRREKMLFDEWWLGFLVTFVTIGISSLISSFYTAKKYSSENEDNLY